MITIGIYGIADFKLFLKTPTYTHDHNIAIMKNGNVYKYLQLERFTGYKHDNSLPENIDKLLCKYIEKDEKVRFVLANSHIGSSFISSGGNLRIEPRSDLVIKDIMMPAFCNFYLNGKKHKNSSAFIISHEFAHIASILPFAGGFKPDSLLVHIDGGAYRSNSSVWHYDGNRVQSLHYDWKTLKDYS